MNWGYLIGGGTLVLSLLVVLHRLIVGRKDATIETLQANNKWLGQQLEQANNNSPDVQAERLSKRLARQKEELQQLSSDYEANRTLIQQKEEELAQTNSEVTHLKDQMERAEELLGGARISERTISMRPLWCGINNARRGRGRIQGLRLRPHIKSIYQSSLSPGP